MVIVPVHLKTLPIRYRTFLHFSPCQFPRSITSSIFPHFWPSIPPHSYGNSLSPLQKLPPIHPDFLPILLSCSSNTHSHLPPIPFNPILEISYSPSTTLPYLPIHPEIMTPSRENSKICSFSRFAVGQIPKICPFLHLFPALSLPLPDTIHVVTIILFHILHARLDPPSMLLSREISILSIFPFLPRILQMASVGVCEHNYELNAYRCAWIFMTVSAHTNWG